MAENHFSIAFLAISDQYSTFVVKFVRFRDTCTADLINVEDIEIRKNSYKPHIFEEKLLT